MNKYQILDSFSELRRELTLQITPNLAKFKLSLQQLLILRRLLESPCSLVELTELTMNDKASVSRSVTALEESEFVTRKISETDKRKIEIELTAEGKTLAKKSLLGRDPVIDNINAVLSPSERNELSRLMKKLSDGLKEMRS